MAGTRAGGHASAGPIRSSHWSLTRALEPERGRHGETACAPRSKSNIPAAQWAVKGQNRPAVRVPKPSESALWRPRPLEEALEDLLQHVGTAGALEPAVQHLADDPLRVGLGPPDRHEWATLERGAPEIDAHPPPRVVERLDGDAVGMLPLAVAVVGVPRLDLSERVHVGSGLGRARPIRRGHGHQRPPAGALLVDLHPREDGVLGLGRAGAGLRGEPN